MRIKLSFLLTCLVIFCLMSHVTASDLSESNIMQIDDGLNLKSNDIAVVSDSPDVSKDYIGVETFDDDFTEEAKLIDEMRYQDYLGWYNTYYEEFHPKNGDKEREIITDDIVFEMELVKQVQINIRYILSLVQQYHDSNCEDKEIIVKIRKQMDASPDMRDKRDLIEKFIAQMTPMDGKDVGEEWGEYIEREKKEELDTIINDEHLKPAETIAFMKRAFADGYVTETGTGIAKILPPSNPFLPESGEKKQTVIDKLKMYLNKFLNTAETYYSAPQVHINEPYVVNNDGMKMAAEDNI